MDFQEKQAIYLQIADFISEQILLKRYPENEKLISIRDMAVQLEVNPNTVQRTYDYLQQLGIIRTHRGIGYFVEPNAQSTILNLKREKFMTTELPLFFRKLQLLGISLEELQLHYHQFTKLPQTIS